MQQKPFDIGLDLDRMLAEAVGESACESGKFICGLRSVAAAVIRGWLRVYHRLSIVGRENLPLDRSFILIANHSSHLDTLCLQSALPIRRLHSAFPVAARDYFCQSVLRAFVARVVVNALPFERQFIPWQSLTTCMQLLQKPRNILILFPEGTRSGSFELGEFKQGVGLLTAGRDVPIVPCHLSGTDTALPKGSWFPWPKTIQLTIGAPCIYAHLPANKESRMQICSELREAVLALGRTEPDVYSTQKVSEQKDKLALSKCEVP